MEEEKKEDILKSIKEQIDTKIKEIKEQQVQQGNIDFLYKLIDIKKDIVEIDKEEFMRYSNYGNYGDDSYGRRGRYRDSRSYGRRGLDTKYRGEDMLNEMYESYGDYMENGSYGGPETMKALKYMLKSAEDFFKHIQEEAQSPEEIEMVKETAKRISMM